MQMRAGSLVINEKKELLLIYRKGKWDFPKGKVEKNEKKKTGALREASEETGLEIEKLSLQQPLKKTAHLLKQKKIKTKWYLVNYKGSKKKLRRLRVEDTFVNSRKILFRKYYKADEIVKTMRDVLKLAKAIK